VCVFVCGEGGASSGRAPAPRVCLCVGKRRQHMMVLRWRDGRGGHVRVRINGEYVDARTHSECVRCVCVCKCVGDSWRQARACSWHAGHGHAGPPAHLGSAGSRLGGRVHGMWSCVGSGGSAGTLHTLMRAPCRHAWSAARHACERPPISAPTVAALAAAGARVTMGWGAAWGGSACTLLLVPCACRRPFRLSSPTPSPPACSSSQAHHRVQGAVCHPHAP
jgi:hypothetical protein